MAKSSITAFAVEEIVEKTGFRGKKTVADELLRMETAGGNIYLRKSAVERAGDDWKTLKGRVRNLAAEKDIPYADSTAQS